MKDENGYITTEAAGTFMLFVLLVVSILSLVNIVTMQTRVHYALTQTASALSIYAYALEATGIADGMIAMEEHAVRVRRGVDEIRSDINSVAEGINSLSLGDAAGHAETAIDRVLGWGEDIADDPMEAMRLMMNYGLSESAGSILGQLVRPLIGRYLSNGSMTGDEYLKSVNVVDGLDGFEFGNFSVLNPEIVGHGSAMINHNGDVRLVVHYEVEYRFGALPLPFRPTLSVTQTVETKAWLGGRGEGYRRS